VDRRWRGCRRRIKHKKKNKYAAVRGAMNPTRMPEYRPTRSRVLEDCLYQGTVESIFKMNPNALKFTYSLELTTSANSSENALIKRRSGCGANFVLEGWLPEDGRNRGSPVKGAPIFAVLRGLKNRTASEYRVLGLVEGF